MHPSTGLEERPSPERSSPENPSEQSDQPRSTYKVAWQEIALGFALAVFVVCCCINKHAPPYDLFWQLRSGHDILAGHQILHSDPYSWTRHGAPWVAEEWLTYVLFWKAFHLGHGFLGMWLLEIVLAVGAFLLLYGILIRIRACHPVLAFALAAGAAMLSAPYLAPRPQLVTYVFLTVTLGVILAVQQGRLREGVLWALVPLYILWFNLHVGALVGVGVMALTAIGIGVEWMLSGRADPERPTLSRQIWLFAALGMACLLTVLLTPYHLDEVRDFLATVHNSAAMDMVGEWRPLNVHEAIGRETEILIVVAALSFALSRERRRISEVLIVLVFSHEALLYTRNVPLLAIVVVVMIAPHIRSALGRIYETAGKVWPRLMSDITPSDVKGAATLASLFLMALVLYRCYTTYGHVSASHYRTNNILARTVDYTFAPDLVPYRACRFIQQENFPTSMRMLNEYGYGGYLIWRLPDHPVFIDGRADVYFGRVLNDYYKLGDVPYDWRGLLAPYNPDFVLVSRGRSWTILFMNAPNWALVYADSPNLDQSNNQLIFVRRQPQYMGLIARCRRDCPALSPSAELSHFAGYPALN